MRPQHAGGRALDGHELTSLFGRRLAVLQTGVAAEALQVSQVNTPSDGFSERRA